MYKAWRGGGQNRKMKLICQTSNGHLLCGSLGNEHVVWELERKWQVKSGQPSAVVSRTAWSPTARVQSQSHHLLALWPYGGGGLVAKSCPTLASDPMDCSPPGSSVHGIFQGRILEWIAISFSGGSSQPKVRTQSSMLQVDSLLSEPPGNQNLYRNPNIWYVLIKCYQS